MGTVTDIGSRRPHLSGEARCVNCKHEWVAVVPAGTVWLECPECSLLRGRLIRHCEHQDHDTWTCNCGNDLFFVTPTGILCPNCGVYQIFPY